jgi:CubicO group peptidase (beta-lactamase class C family)
MVEQLQLVDQVIDEAVAAERVVGASVLVAQHGKIIFERHAGWADRERRLPVSANTIFRLASMTKPIVSAATLALCERGVVTLDEPITRWLPAFTPKAPDGTVGRITLRHLLSHASGLSYGFHTQDNEPYRSAGVSDGLDESVLSLDENLRRLATVPLLFAPGTSCRYSYGIDVAGGVLEHACHKPLTEVVAQYITAPLGMTDSVFYIDAARQGRLATAYADSLQKTGDGAGSSSGAARIMQAQDQVSLIDAGPIQYAPGRIMNLNAYPSGGAGMAATAYDYLRFLEAVRNGGNPILQRASVELMTTDAVPQVTIDGSPGIGYGLGFSVIRDAQAAATPRHIGSYERGGVYGTKSFVDPVAGLSVIILTNTALEGLVGAFPIDVTRALYQALAL